MCRCVLMCVAAVTAPQALHHVLYVNCMMSCHVMMIQQPCKVGHAECSRPITSELLSHCSHHILSFILGEESSGTDFEVMSVN